MKLCYSIFFSSLLFIILSTVAEAQSRCNFDLEPQDGAEQIEDDCEPESATEYYNTSHYNLLSGELNSGDKKTPQFDSEDDDFDIFLKLMDDTNLIDDLQELREDTNGTVQITFLIPSDLVLRSTIRELWVILNETTGIPVIPEAEQTSDIQYPDEKQTYDLMLQFTELFENPRNILVLIVRNHIIRASVGICDLTSSESLLSFANFRIIRSGIFLCSKRNSTSPNAISDQLAQFRDSQIILGEPWSSIQTNDGIIYRIDRLLLPDLSNEPLSDSISTNSTSTPLPSDLNNANNTPNPSLNSNSSPAPTATMSLNPGNDQNNSDNQSNNSKNTPFPSQTDVIDSFPNASPSISVNSSTDDAGGNSDDPDSDSGVACFPYNMKLLMTNKQWKSMGELNIGDQIITNYNQHKHGNSSSGSSSGSSSSSSSIRNSMTHDEIILFSHKMMTRRKLQFIRLQTSNYHVELSRYHFIHVYRKRRKMLTYASDVKLNDLLFTLSGLQRIISISASWNYGLYAPHTMNGDIIVNGITCSCYTKAIQPSTAHTLLSPLRAIVKLRLISAHTLFGDVFNCGAPTTWLQAVLKHYQQQDL